jgi:hypothetical protein
MTSVWFLEALFVLVFCFGVTAVVGDVAVIERSDVRSDLAFRWVRYCEILASRNRLGISHALEFTAYNTLLRGCPQELWEGVTEKLIQDMDGSWIVKLNGPRGWTFDTVASNSTLVDNTLTNINGIDMVVVGIVEATLLDIAVVLVGGNNNYKPRTVQRRTMYIFYAGQPIFFLQSPEGRVFVMQSYSQQYFHVDMDNLPSLGPQLSLPTGWSYNYVNDGFLNVYSECEPSLLRRAIGSGNRVESFTHMTGLQNLEF